MRNVQKLIISTKQKDQITGVKAIENATHLQKREYLLGPGAFIYSENNFNIYKDLNYKLNGCLFSYSNSKCRRKFSTIL